MRGAPGEASGVRDRLIAISDGWHRRFSEEHLLVFDRRLQCFLGGALLLAALAVAFGIHGSSMHRWDRSVPPADPEDSYRGVLLGEPKAIRSDEFINYTPAILSQVARRMPVRNAAMGGLEAPLLANVPTRHFSTVFRPQLWGFFLLDVERGFAWFWAFKTLGLLVSSVLLLLILTGNRFWLSLLGSAWIYLSGFVQWFFSVPFLPELLASANFAAVAALYVLFSRRPLAIYLGAVSLTLFSVSAALTLYLPFLVPVLYLMVAVIIGMMLRRGASGRLRQCLGPRLVSLVAALAAIGGAMFLYYLDARESLDALAATIYPGARVFRSGFLQLDRYFNGFFGVFMSQQDYPGLWPNICESSNFILLFPVVAIAVLAGLVLREKVDPVLISLFVYIAAMSRWLVWGYPEGVASSLLLDKIHWRGVLGVGVASILLTIIYLAERGRKKSLPFLPSAVISVAVLAVICWYGLALAERSEFFTPLRVALAAISTGLLGFFLLRRAPLPFALVLLLNLVPNLLVNPVARGLRPILGKPIIESAARLVRERPEATWIVYDDIEISNFLKSSGAPILGGYHMIPHEAMLRTLDPSWRFSEIHQRSANVKFVSSADPRVGGEDLFELRSLFHYSIYLGPCAKQLADLGTDYVVVRRQNAPDWASCATSVGSYGRFEFLELRFGPGTSAS